MAYTRILEQVATGPIAATLRGDFEPAKGCVREGQTSLQRVWELEVARRVIRLVVRGRTGSEEQGEFASDTLARERRPTGKQAKVVVDDDSSGRQPLRQVGSGTSEQREVVVEGEPPRSVQPATAVLCRGKDLRDSLRPVRDVAAPRLHVSAERLRCKGTDARDPLLSKAGIKHLDLRQSQRLGCHDRQAVAGPCRGRANSPKRFARQDWEQRLPLQVDPFPCRGGKQAIRVAGLPSDEIGRRRPTTAGLNDSGGSSARELCDHVEKELVEGGLLDQRLPCNRDRKWGIDVALERRSGILAHRQEAVQAVVPADFVCAHGDRDHRRVRPLEPAGVDPALRDALAEGATESLGRHLDLRAEERALSPELDLRELQPPGRWYCLHSALQGHWLFTADVDVEPSDTVEEEQHRRAAVDQLLQLPMHVAGRVLPDRQADDHVVPEAGERLDGGVALSGQRHRQATVVAPLLEAVGRCRVAISEGQVVLGSGEGEAEAFQSPVSPIGPGRVDLGCGGDEKDGLEPHPLVADALARMLR